MAHYDIFRQELAIQYPGYGHALWEPSPGVLYPPVEIGDVGFIREGQFHRLFNALLPADHPSHQNFGVPEYYEPLQLNMQQHIVPRILSPNNFCSSEAVVTSDIVFMLEARRNLSLPVPARRLETVAKGVFGKWIVNHIDRWFAFTQRLGLGITRMEDILLVTGCDLTRSWANIAFLQGRGEARVSFGVQVNAAPNIEWQFPPEERQGVALNLGPNGQNLPEDQCIFIRGFRVTRLLGILPRLRGAGGPSQNPDQDPDEPELDMQLLNLSADSNYQDPLHKLLGYIAMTTLFGRNKVIGNSPAKHSDGSPSEDHAREGSEAKTPILNVATLSKDPFGAPANFSQPLGVPASNLPSPSDIARDLFSPSPTDMHADRDAVGPLTTPFREPGQSSHEPQDDNTKTQPMKRTKPSRSTRKYDAATKAQFEDQGTSLQLELPRKDIGLTHPVKTLHDRGQRMPPVSAAGHMERSLLPNCFGDYLRATEGKECWQIYVFEIRPEWLLELTGNYYNFAPFADGKTKRALQLRAEEIARQERQGGDA
ncbi:hypothetical protein BC826DRAFT_973174 [Russula brevipes]|nr:hypothetical protein BC826DRAFT_973174 [Russula brevipes]